MIETMSPQARKLLGAIGINFELLKELEKTQPHEVEQIVKAMVDHVRAWKPMVLLASQDTP